MLNALIHVFIVYLLNTIEQNFYYRREQKKNEFRYEKYIQKKPADDTQHTFSSAVHNQNKTTKRKKRLRQFIFKHFQIPSMQQKQIFQAISKWHYSIEMHLIFSQFFFFLLC